ncbi:hypothetical protein DIJ64_12855 [Mycobacterium leprae]|uniref:Uncharacterized protein n=1 Tax=Mycobacterium leprae TaxID=1769 RepID=A0AAD0KTS0_MYCLR|nr:hypothetical protein DIJ64_12855 [Mycobacterium leprae]
MPGGSSVWLANTTSTFGTKGRQSLLAQAHSAVLKWPQPAATSIATVIPQHPIDADQIDDVHIYLITSIRNLITIEISYCDVNCVIFWPVSLGFG